MSGQAPAYRKLGLSELSEKVRAAEEMLRSCRLCGHACGVNRTSGERGECDTLDEPVVSSYGPHVGEEPPLVGTGGSGTIFFTNCNLKCIFCQNYDISQLGRGDTMLTEQLSGIMLGLQEMGCHNINLVSPTHQMPMILTALFEAASRGLSLPVVYNTGGYDSLETLKILEGVVDIYMPDMKYSSASASSMLCGTGDYPEVNRKAVSEMHRQVGDLKLDRKGLAVRGLIVRHLVLPGGLAGSESVFRYIAGNISEDTYLNIMDQYRPCHKAVDKPPLNRRINDKEWREAMDLAAKHGLKRLAE
jgi:putative pyruvate formate lyase activating enzyme